MCSGDKLLDNSPNDGLDNSPNDGLENSPINGSDNSVNRELLEPSRFLNVLNSLTEVPFLRGDSFQDTSLSGDTSSHIIEGSSHIVKEAYPTHSFTGRMDNSETFTPSLCHSAISPACGIGSFNDENGSYNVAENAGYSVNDENGSYNVAQSAGYSVNDTGGYNGIDTGGYTDSFFDEDLPCSGNF